MNGNTSIYNTQARGTLIEKRIESLRWDETPPEGLKYKEEKVPSQNVSFITRPDPKEIYEPIDEREEDDFEFFQLSQQTQRMDLNKMDVEQSKSLNTKSQDVSQVSSNATPSTDTSQKNEEKVKLSFKDIVSNLGKSQIPDDQKRQNLQEICAAQQGTQLHKAKGKKYPHKAQAKPRQTQLCSFQADQIVNKKRGFALSRIDDPSSQNSGGMIEDVENYEEGGLAVSKIHKKLKIEFELGKVESVQVFSVLEKEFNSFEKHRNKTNKTQLN